MKNENFVINGQKQNSSAANTTSEPKHSNVISSKPLKPQPSYQRNSAKLLRRKPGVSMDIARSKNVSRFAPSRNPQVQTSASENSTPQTHPIVAMGEHKQLMIRNHLARQKKTPQTPEAIKQQAIAEALAQPKVIPKQKSFIGRHFKLAMSMAFIVIGILTAYLTYSNIPSFSVKVASAQAGINATFPGYTPEGYSISGPVIYSNNQVVIKFKSNTDNTKFEISQTRSSWDSTAVKAMVEKDSNNIFSTTEERGLTVYIYNSNAAWVNGGILYEITGNALLSSYQVRKIATSL